MRSASRLLFCGGTPRGLAVLKRLVADGAPLVGVYAFEQDAHEHHRVEEQIHQLAAEADVPCRTVRKIGPEEERQILEELQPDLALVIGWAVILGHDAGGVTLMHLAAGVDDGDIVDQRRIPLGPRATAPELYDAVTDATVELVADHLPALLAGAAPRTAQRHEDATYFCARTPEDGEIDWHAPTATIDRLVRGLTYPYPGAWTTLHGQRLGIWEAEPATPSVPYEGAVPGRVVARHDDGGVDVLTGDGVLRLRNVGDHDSRVPAANALRSVKETLGR